MNPGDLFGRGIAFPPRVGADGRVAWSAGPTNIAESIQIILLTEPGERMLLPEFGGRLKRFLYESNTVATRRLIAGEIETALKRWEPRIALQGVDVQPDAGDERAAIATVRYALIATQAAEQVRLRVQLAR
jgi:phage baseplate assembly protein W